MAIPVSVHDMDAVLRPWLGALFLNANDLSAELAHLTGEYAPYRQTLPQLHKQVDHVLLTRLSRYTRGSMSVVLESYRTRRLTLQDLEYMSDDVMGVVFDCLTPFSVNFEKLNDYALHEPSMQALRVLYQRYQGFFTEEQYRFLAKMVRTIYPRERYQSWLKDDAQPANP